MGLHHLIKDMRTPKPNWDEKFAPYCLPNVAPIERLPEAVDRLRAARSREEAIATIRAYIQPKVETKGAKPVTALQSLAEEVPERIPEMKVVWDVFGLKTVRDIALNGGGPWYASHGPYVGFSGAQNAAYAGN
ncbi:uncharacterized protein EHS24_000504 [Apiotrichum porosum]|uniref:Uncharacterized protein n=1 Tax=Apiotrichum porosum TaxID=105984 RepID=A0A427Y9Z5_9TREE|nr:uncharacterized protein EHS24_000504 [Apiotrichum porosum]RSH87981.1 hypothetical protein EHS24_000504 [Apiotrichum porosum]